MRRPFDKALMRFKDRIEFSRDKAAVEKAKHEREVEKHTAKGEGFVPDWRPPTRRDIRSDARWSRGKSHEQRKVKRSGATHTLDGRLIEDVQRKTVARPPSKGVPSRVYRPDANRPVRRSKRRTG